MQASYTSGSRPHRQWSQQFGQYMTYDARYNQYILESGQRIAAGGRGPPAQTITRNAGMPAATPRATPVVPSTQQAIYRSQAGHPGFTPSPMPNGQDAYTSGARTSRSSQYANAGGASAQAASTGPSTNDEWVADAVPRYRLSKDIVEGWLRRRFGNHNYDVKVCSTAQ